MHVWIAWDFLYTRSCLLLKDSFTPPFFSLLFFFLNNFSCPIVLAKISSTLLMRVGILILSLLIEESYSFSPLGMMLAVGINLQTPN